MSRLLSLAAALLAVLLVPLSLSGTTAPLLLPAHFAFAVVVCTGAVIDALDGAFERARRWGRGFVLASIAMCVALRFGTDVNGLSAGLPWASLLLWGWIPPVVCAFTSRMGASQQQTLPKGSMMRRRMLQRRAA